MKTMIIPKSEAPVLRAYGDELQFHLGAAQTGVCTMFTDTTPPGGGPPPHFHVNEDEWWFVLEGQVEFFNSESWTRVAPGGAVFMPKNSLHTFRNAGDQPSRQITLTAPAGFETFFKDSAALFEVSGAPDLQHIREVGAAGGIYFPTLAPEDATRRGQPVSRPVMTQPEQARVLRAFGEEVRVLLDGRQTGGLFAAFVEITPPDGGPPPHFHEREDEWFYVLDGCVSFFCGRQMDGRTSRRRRLCPAPLCAHVQEQYRQSHANVDPHLAIRL